MGELDVSRPSLGRLNIARASGSICAGKYRVFANIGRGGMAEVLLGVAPGTRGFNKLLVIKRLRSALAGDPTMVSMFLDEARLAARLGHTNLVHTFEIGEEAGVYFIVMEYLEGRPVSQILEALKDTNASLPIEVWVKIVSEALAGLHYAHELTDYDGAPLNVVHRDVSPQNIVVTFEGEVKLVDFGIAKTSVNVTETDAGIVKGKLAYMAPEQSRFDGKLDRRADVFSMGVVLWECLAMCRLITGDATSVAMKLRDMTFPPPSSENQAVPPELDAIVMRALERDPAARFQTADEMRTALEGFLRTSGHYVQEAAIGGPITKLFAEQREDVRAQIRMHMADLRSERELSEEGADGKDGKPSQPAARTGDVEWPKEIASLPKIDVTESARSVRAVQKSAAPSRRSKAGKRAWRWGTALGAAFGLLLAIVWLTPPVDRSPITKPSAAAALEPLSALKTPPSMRVALRASPAEAVITLDDAVLANPFSGFFLRDDLEHRLQVTREGYETDARLLRFDGDDVDLAVTLTPLPDAGASIAKPKATVTPPPRTQITSRPRLDSDPYK
jgi:serine/threonine protein kinase